MNNSQTSSSGFMAWSILLLLSLIWGSSFILIKKSLLAFTPMQVGTGRIVFAFLAFTPLLWVQLRRLKRENLIPILVVGICGSALPAILYATAQTEIPSATAGLLNALTPIFTFLLALAFFGSRFFWKQLMGIIMGLGGTALIFLSKTDAQTGFPILYGLMIVGATLCYAISANTVGTKLKGIHPLVISTISFCMIGPMACVYLLTTDFVHQACTHEQGLLSLTALIILSLVGTFGANIVFFKLIQITDAIFSSSVSFITPIVALAWGLWDGEKMTLHFFMALLLILAGVFLVKYGKRDVKS